MGSETRKRNLNVMVRLSENEKEQIKNQADKCDLLPSTYLRQLGLAYEPKSTIDHQAIEHLASLNNDLNRIGGLLKMWLSDKNRAGFADHLNIKDVIADLKITQNSLYEVIDKL